MRIRSWRAFGRKIRPENEHLLKNLADYPNAILISGCQRSGGTMLAAEFSRHPKVTDFAWSKDAELDAAALLAGVAPTDKIPEQHQRYCFQTTYLNDRYSEYLTNETTFYLVWLIRNPQSVIYSMLYNWARFALNEVFVDCGAKLMPEDLQNRLSRYGVLSIKRLDRACFAYLGKLAQAEFLHSQLPAESLKFVHYEDLVTQKQTMLEELFCFTKLESIEVPNSTISKSSMGKASNLSTAEQHRISELCDAAYAKFLQTVPRVKQ